MLATVIAGGVWDIYREGGWGLTIAVSGIVVGLLAIAIIFFSIFVVTAISAPYALWIMQNKEIEDLVDQITPKLRIRYLNEDSFLHNTKLSHFDKNGNLIGRTNARFLHVEPYTEGGPVTGCRGYLRDVEVLDDNNQWQTSLFSSAEDLPLKWSGHGGDDFAPRTIRRRMHQHLDVVVGLDGTGSFHPCTYNMAWPAWISELGGYPAKYRLTVAVVPDQGVESTIKLVLTWTGKWNEMEARVDEAQ